MSGIGFIILLPLGALLARWDRKFVPGPIWFTGHWVFNFFLGTLSFSMLIIWSSYRDPSWSGYCRWVCAHPHRSG
jgi:hypothetical protein